MIKIYLQILYSTYFEIQIDRVCLRLFIRESELFLEGLHHAGVHRALEELSSAEVVVVVGVLVEEEARPGGNCIKIGLLGKLILSMRKAEKVFRKSYSLESSLRESIFREDLFYTIAVSVRPFILYIVRDFLPNIAYFVYFSISK